MEKQQILIVDDEEVNRAILHEMFRNTEEYELLEAANGQEAIIQIENSHNLILILLDVVMPIMNGFKVLEYMQEHDLLEKIPVILITSEDALDTDDQAYAYGVADVIHKPFYPHIVRRRSRNIIELYQSRFNMERRLREQEEEIRAQVKEIRESNEFMIDALSSVVEFRSAETGEHTRRIKYFTRIMLKYLMKYFPKYGLTNAKIDMIARASALHDIGKIGIPDAILLKPGKLTNEEFEVMKSHTTRGCEIIDMLGDIQQGEYRRVSYEICRHHHERYDGRGYPDHLQGEDIPIAAQIVSVADVYDALVHKRVYKAAFTPDVAYNMIVNGECGAFSPKLMGCLTEAKDEFEAVVLAGQHNES